MRCAGSAGTGTAVPSPQTARLGVIMCNEFPGASRPPRVPSAGISTGVLRCVRFTLPLSAALMLSGCAGSGLELAALSTADPASGSAASSTTSSAIETGALPALGKSAAVSPADREGSSERAATPEIAKARKLRANGDLQGAMTALEKAAEGEPDSKPLLKERGLLALEMGQIGPAKNLLTKADDGGTPDWRIKSALGAAHAASGDQPAAQRAFSEALKLAPEHPSILNNLALSYALDGRHKEAEQLLRRAARSKAAAPKASQNLALLLGLNGNIEEARQVSEESLPKDLARSNISYLERLRSNGSRVSRVERRPAEDITPATATLNALENGN